MMVRRPQRSARREEKGDMSRARREVEEVMMDLVSGVSGVGEREVCREMRVAEITPVSSGFFFLLDVAKAKGRGGEGGDERGE